MGESILTSIKKLLGIPEEVTDFDVDIIIHINTVLSILYQLGMPQFAISSKSDLWQDYITDATDLELVKSYVYAKVRLLFDPPTNSAALDSLTRLVSELEFRINVAVDRDTSGEEGT